MHKKQSYFLLREMNPCFVLSDASAKQIITSLSKKKKKSKLNKGVKQSEISIFVVG